MGLVRTPPEKRDPAAIEAGIAACETLFAILDDELSRHQWLSGDAFGLGDIAVAPFIYNLLETVKPGNRARTCSAGISRLTSARPGATW
jgi:glutathione S-transferase